MSAHRYEFLFRCVLAGCLAAGALACGDDDGAAGPCGTERADCDDNGSCETDLTSPSDCGACGVSCHDNAYCGAMSVCRCYPGYRMVGEACIPTNEALSPPVITRQPIDVDAAVGEEATFSVEASGEDLQYVWRLRRDDFDQEVGYEATYTISDVNTFQAGEYWVVVSNVAGEVESDHVRLTLAAQEICTATELNTIVRDDPSGNYKLVCDIDLSENPDGDNDTNWFAPLPDFGGRFDGNGHTISGWQYSDTSGAYVALFGTFYGELLNLTVEDFVVEGAGQTGALAAWVYGEETWISDCHARNVQVIGADTLGGLLAYVDGAFIAHSSFEGSVTGTGSTVGGLVGYLSNATLSHCRADATVEGYGQVGGLVGAANGYQARVADSYATGSVTGQTSVGGLLGSLGEGHLDRSYTTTQITAPSAGGLVGSSYLSEITDSYWDTQRTGVATSEGGTGLTTAELQVASAFAGWDGTESWQFVAGADPVLRVNDNPELLSVTPSSLSPLGGETLTLTLRNAHADTILFPQAEHVCVPGTEERSGDELTCTTIARQAHAVTLWVQNPDARRSNGLSIAYRSMEESDLFAEGSGTAADPYILSTAADINALHGLRESSAVHLRLGNDIDIHELDTTPVFQQTAAQFSLDGDGHSLSGFHYRAPRSLHGDLRGNNKAWIGSLGQMGRVTNLTFADAEVDGFRAAALVGDLQGELAQVTIADARISGNQAALMVVQNSGTIVDAVAQGEATGVWRAAGIVLDLSGSISDSQVEATLDAPTAGGLIARAGYTLEGMPATIARCSAAITHTGSNLFGGLVGESDYQTTLHVSDSIAVAETDAFYSGGLLGRMLSASTEIRFSRCLSAVSTSAIDSGGVTTYAEATTPLVVEACFWDTTVGPAVAIGSGDWVVTGALGQTTAQLQMEATFTGWDFETVWLSSAADYPTLR